MKHASEISKYHVHPDVFDADPWKLAVANGVIDLRTGKRTPHSPSNYITKALSVVHDEQATAPTFLALVERLIPKPENLNLFQRFGGCALTGDVEEEATLWLYGPGGNGKSTAVKGLRYVLGKDSRRPPSGASLHQESSHLPGALTPRSSASV